MLAEALATHAPEPPKAVIIGARALNGQMNQMAVTERLGKLGFGLETESPLSSALLFHMNLQETGARAK
jgi:hypothetical protein